MKNREHIFSKVHKVYKHPDRLSQFLKGQKPLPVTIELHPTNLCAQNCYYCRSSTRNKATMNREGLLSAIKKIEEMGAKAICFSGGGEPLLNPYFDEGIRLSYKLGLDVGILTGGVELNAERIDLICDIATWLRFSLDSNNEKDYCAIRGTKHFKKVIENIQKTVSRKKQTGSSLRIGVQALVLKENWNKMYEIAKFVKELGVDYFQFRPLEYMSYDSPLEKKIYNPRDLEFLNTLEDDSFNVVDTKYRWDALYQERTPCLGLDFIGVVGANGNVYCCTHKVDTNDNRYVYGNIFNDSVADILANRERVQKTINFDECPIVCNKLSLNRALYNLKKIRHGNFL